MLITSKDNSRVKEIRKLFNKKYSNEMGLFVIDGENLIDEAIKNNLLVELYVLEGVNCKYDFEYNTLTSEVMKSITDMKSVPRYIGVSKYSSKNILGDKIVLLDDIQDPGNAGTIIRNCVAFGIDTVVFSKNSVSPYNEKVLRSTGGMIFNINIIIDELDSVIDEIKNRGISLIGTSLHTDTYLEDFEKSDKFAIIFGNEGNGVKDALLDKCDKLIKICMSEDCESLNVGVSTGIVLYHMFKG
ncbi:MAG: RNA methyltransferase [Bacilli bacterium]|nr:RNA methyltransferase [Bacilli bacterium]